MEGLQIIGLDDPVLQRTYSRMFDADKEAFPSLRITDLSRILRSSIRLPFLQSKPKMHGMRRSAVMQGRRKGRRRQNPRMFPKGSPFQTAQPSAMPAAAFPSI
ncbi:putative cell-division protein [Neisseria gonorrhoeae]|uniref:Putative cell-division protein n=1 Tax=Neisseria gonorrhoeae TaxID=485 RepID=A0A378VWI6_NEIGO|nr:putative cell-division protein [Neisseria gonorrhoeae]